MLGMENPLLSSTVASSSQDGFFGSSVPVFRCWIQAGKEYCHLCSFMISKCKHHSILFVLQEKNRGNGRQSLVWGLVKVWVMTVARYLLTLRKGSLTYGNIFKNLYTLNTTEGQWYLHSKVTSEDFTHRACVLYTWKTTFCPKIIMCSSSMHSHITSESCIQIPD